KQQMLLNQLQQFLEKVSGLVERGDLRNAILYYDLNRKVFPDGIPELARFDSLMITVRKKAVSGITS
nr:hypothetical protein [Chitinispirillaceae bacterium]